MTIKNRIGEVKFNNSNYKMTIVEYNCYDKIVVQFENGYRVETSYGKFKNGQIKSPYEKSVFGVGYVGEGKYITKLNGKRTIQYSYWFSMLNRCYNDKNKVNLKNLTYEDKYVCEDWHNFQNFAKWFDENYYAIDGDKMQLDKDIFKKGNKVYSPDMCVFVPQRINNLFTRSDKMRGSCPVGVSYKKNNRKFNAQCSIYQNDIKRQLKVYLGLYNTPEEAFYVYKEFKEGYIKQVADEYKDKIPKKLYDAMYRYMVEITD